MAKLPEFKTKPIKGVTEDQWSEYTVARENLRDNLATAHRMLKENPELLKAAMEKRSNNPNWRASRGQQHDINSTKVIVHKGTKVGNARWGTLDLIDIEYFGTYDSMGDAAKATGVTKAAVSSCVNGKIRFAKGYTFEEIKS